jgi:hypothetical protein
LRLSVALQCQMQKEMGGSIYCTQAELPKSALIARLLVVGAGGAEGRGFCV